MFQFTPTHFRAGDDTIGIGPQRGPGVSTHAHPFQSGRLDPPQHPVGDAHVSTHAHPFQSGRRPRAWLRLQMPPVSTHAHPFQSGRPAASILMVSPRVFQPTPTHFRAGDASRAQHGSAPRTSFNPRPPISERATSSGPSGTGTLAAFQPTPTHFRAGDHPQRSATPTNPGFNPRPPISERATGARGRARRPQDVSTHAHPFQSGRPQNRTNSRRSRKFQPTPTHFRAGDVR